MTELTLSDFKPRGIIRGGYSLLSLIKSNLILSNFLFLKELLKDSSRFFLFDILGNCYLLSFESALYLFFKLLFSIALVSNSCFFVMIVNNCLLLISISL